MIYFQTINDAINYKINCPLCHTGIVSLNSSDVKSYQSFDGFRDTLTWTTSQEEVVINLNNDTIEKMTLKSGSVQNFGYNTTVNYVSQSSSSINNGTMYLRMGFNCEKCRRYYYMAQILVDTKSFKAIKILLNSESILLEDEKGSHEITNTYTMAQTEYLHFTNSNPGPFTAGKAITLPLIDLDLDHPEKTLERIRTLIVFS